MSDQEEKKEVMDADPQAEVDQAVAEQPAPEAQDQPEASEPSDGEQPAPEISQVELENLESPQKTFDQKAKMEMIMDIVLPVSIELGRTKLYVKDILELERGSIIELDKMAGEPVDLYINNKKMAEGEVIVVEKHFGIRITNLIDPADRIKSLGKET